MENLANILTSFMQEYYNIAIIISIIISTIIAVIGVLPSIFVTMANIVVFGPIGGFLISVCGESIGGVVSFLLYRKGFKEISSDLINKNEKISKIVNSEGKEARQLIFSFRLFPYMPSGLVTYASAVGKVSLIDFTIASTLGKIPALFVEVILSIGILAALNLPINLIITIVSVILIAYFVYKKIK